MTQEHPAIHIDERTRQAVAELERAIGERYPGARFSLSHPDDEPASVELTAVVDVDDTDEVLDLVLDRVLELQLEEGVPIHVVPIRTPERVVAYLQEHPSGRLVRRSVPILGRLPRNER